MYIFSEEGKKLNEFRKNEVITVVPCNQCNKVHVKIYEENGKLVITYSGIDCLNKKMLEIKCGLSKGRIHMAKLLFSDRTLSGEAEARDRFTKDL